MSNQRNLAPGSKPSKSTAIPEPARADSFGINGLVDPSDSVVFKKERNVHSPIGEEAIRGSPPTPLQLPPGIGSPSYGRRPSLSSASNSPPASIWSEITTPLVLPPMPTTAPRTQTPLGTRMSPPVVDGQQRASPPWDQRATNNVPNKTAFAPPGLKPSPPRTWSEAAKAPTAPVQQAGRRSTFSKLGNAPDAVPAAATIWDQPPPPQRRGSLSNPEPIARPVPPSPQSSILGFMLHGGEQQPAPSVPLQRFVEPTPVPHMQALLGPSGKHDEFHKSLIPRSVPLSNSTGPPSGGGAPPGVALPKAPALFRLAVPNDDGAESEGGDSASIASDLSPQISPFTSPRTADDAELAGIFGQMEMDSSDVFLHPHADPHPPGGVDPGMPSGEHPYGEFPSPTLFVRNINSNVEDDELRALFEPFGPIRSMYTQCKHRGFVMISYYEIRHAQSAMTQLQGRLVRRRKLDIHYSIPKSYGSSHGSAHSSPSPSSRSSPSGFHRSASMQRTPSGPWASTSTVVGLQSSSSAPLSYALHLPTFSSPPPPQPQPPPARLPTSASEPLSRSENGAVQRPSSPESTLSTSPKASSVAPPSAPAASKSGGRHHRPVTSEDKSKYDMDLDRIRSGEDTRLTLMIKNIPNKYNQKMLLAAVDERHKGTYDFFYLPIDFKNKCNVGYAFINFVKPISIVAFYQEFNNRKWEKFNSEKVCTISYARIQGKSALIQHFQNSSLMSEDKKCRPIIFHSEGPNQGEQEPFPVGPNIRTRRTVGNKTSKNNMSGRKSGKEEKSSPDLQAQSPSSL